MQPSGTHFGCNTYSFKTLCQKIILCFLFQKDNLCSVSKEIQHPWENIFLIKGDIWPSDTEVKKGVKQNLNKIVHVSVSTTQVLCFISQILLILQLHNESVLILYIFLLSYIINKFFPLLHKKKDLQRQIFQLH